jgi:uncharacterized membrane protein
MPARLYILSTAKTIPVLAKLFNYAAPYYDLSEYQTLMPNAAETIWGMFQRELEHQRGLGLFP